MEKRDPRTVVAIILGGGAGTRLFPLTKRRAKPAVSPPLLHQFSCLIKRFHFFFFGGWFFLIIVPKLWQVPIGGAYRLIDVPMSNCINSGINKVYILTQFNSASLNRHIARAYNFGSGVTFGDGYVEVHFVMLFHALTCLSICMEFNRKEHSTDNVASSHAN